MEWNHYNVHWKLGEQKGKECLTALSKDDARTAFQDRARQQNLPNGLVVTKVIELNRESTPKQKLAQKYGFVIGSIKGASKLIRGAHTEMLLGAGKDAIKVEKNIYLVDAQFAKLLRDIRDLFKLAGLKVK